MKKITIISLASLVLVFMLGLFIFAVLYKLHFFRPKHPNVILITATSLRPDHLSCYGYRAMTTAGIDDIAKSGALFDNAYCGTPMSIDSYGAILTGKNPGSALIKRGDSINLNAKLDTLGEYLGSQGYVTIAITSSPFFLRNISLLRGFYMIGNALVNTKAGDYPSRGERLTQSAIEFLNKYTEEKKKAGIKPFRPVFLWIEYSLPVKPHKVPDAFKQGDKLTPYDREILFLDSQISKLTAELKKLKLDTNTIVIFTSTSGDSLSEHKETGNGLFIYNSTTKIPLIIKAPKRRAAKINTLTTHADIVPTILDLVGLKYKAQDFDGMPMLPKKNKEIADRKFIYLESLMGRDQFGWSPVVGIVSSDGYKYIELPRPELYNLHKDPQETNNIAAADQNKAQALKQILMSYINNNRTILADKIGKGADPKDKIDIAQTYKFKAKNMGEVIEAFKSILAKDPDNKALKLVLAQLYAQNNDTASAKAILEDITKADPDFNRAWESLGMIYTQAKDDDKAIECYEKALAIYPNMPASLNNLAYHYITKDINVPKALEYSKMSNALVPNNVLLLDTLSDVYIKMGDEEKALEVLRKVMAIDPTYEPGNTKLKALESKNASLTKLSPANIPAVNPAYPSFLDNTVPTYATTGIAVPSFDDQSAVVPDIDISAENK